MRSMITGIFCLLTLPVHAETTLIKTYAISGSTGPALYASIGEKGPLLAGGRRVMAYTNWDLKWTRSYVPNGNACTLATAVPHLIITINLPKPAKPLTGAIEAHWKAFITGIEAHEQVHAAAIRAMVETITRETVGLTQDNDPQCKTIRKSVLAKVQAANEAYKATSRAFDSVEMATGGNVNTLVLALVNGG
jgi:predicted secreted Zn-dependent protease